MSPRLAGLAFSESLGINLLDDSGHDLSCDLVKHRFVIGIRAKYKAIFQDTVKISNVGPFSVIPCVLVNQHFPS